MAGLRKTVASAIVCGLIGVLGVTSVPPVAMAATPKMTSAGAMRDCVHTSLAGCASRQSIPAGTALTMHC
jgi:hypothetical protein